MIDRTGSYGNEYVVSRIADVIWQLAVTAGSVEVTAACIPGRNLENGQATGPSGPQGCVAKTRSRVAPGRGADLVMANSGQTREPVLEEVTALRRQIVDLPVGKTEFPRPAPGLPAGTEAYRLLVEAMGDGCGVVDKEATITYVNQRLAQMLGYGPLAERASSRACRFAVKVRQSGRPPGACGWC